MPNPECTGKKILADYMTQQECADELGVTLRTLQRWNALRIGPPVTFIGQRPMYGRPGTAAWVTSREQKPVRERRRASA